MNQIIVYGSEYGTTKRYAEKLSQASGIDAIEYEDVKTLQNYGRIIYLGGLYAGGVKGLKRTAKFIPPQGTIAFGNCRAGRCNRSGKHPQHSPIRFQASSSGHPAKHSPVSSAGRNRLQQAKRFAQNHDDAFIHQSETPAGREKDCRSQSHDRNLQYQSRLCRFQHIGSHPGTNPIKTFYGSGPVSSAPLSWSRRAGDQNDNTMIRTRAPGVCPAPLFYSCGFLRPICFTPAV